MNGLQIAILINVILNILAVIGMIFVERKKPVRIIVWMLVLLIPFAGLMLYVLIGYGLGARTKRLLKKRTLINKEYNDNLEVQKNDLKEDIHSNEIEKKYKDLIMFNLNNANSMFTKNNDVKYFSDGNIMLENLKQDLLNAKHTINVMFYIFANDETGKQILDILIKKAQEGVKVKVLYDSVGSFFTHKFHFKKLKKAGGEINEFFPPFLGIKLLNLKANYRNHRKIVIIDGKVSYTGGMNLRNDHMGKKKKVSPWRDCHLRIDGPATYSLQNIFISDWRLSSKKVESQDYYLNQNYFYDGEFKGDNCLQVVSSGPTDKDDERIKEAMIKMIVAAKKTVYIQTPYFIPDEAFLSAINIALLSGCIVRIMVPRKPDKFLVYAATLSFLKDVQKMGAKIYFYDGFLHTKAVCVDDEIVTIGSCNTDVRSFSLNFEVNTFIYGEEECKKYLEIFNNDMKDSHFAGANCFNEMNIFKKIAMAISKLFSAIL